MRNLGFVTFACIVLLLNTKSQSNLHNTIRFKCLNTDNTLSYNNIQYIQADSSGVVWFSHAQSIWSFDGNVAKQHLPNSGIAGSENIRNIHTLFIDSKGFLWGISDDGIVFYYKKKALHKPEFQLFNLNELTNQKAYGVSAIVESNDNRIWVLGEKKLYVLKNYQFQTAIKINVSDKNTVLLSGKNEVIVYSAISGDADLINLQTLNVKHQIIPTESAGLFETIPQEDLQKSRLIYGWNFLARVNPEQKIAYNYFQYLFGNSLQSPINIISATISGGYAIIGTSNAGLYIIQFSNKKTLHLMNRPDQNFSLPQNQVGCVAADRKGNVWIGTSASGMAVFNLKSLQFGFSTANVPYESFNENKVFSFFEDTRSQKVFIGTLSRGLNILDRKTNRFTYVPQQNPLAPEEYYPLIFTITQDPQTGIYWLGCSGALFTYTDGETNFRRQSPSNELGEDYDYVSMLHLGGDSLLIGTAYKGVIVFNKRSKTYSRIKSLEDLNTKSINTIEKIGDAIWILSANRLTRWSTNSVDKFRINTDPNQIVRPRCPLPISRNKIAFATASHGLGVLNTQDSSVVFYNQKNCGLPSNNILSIIRISANRFWLSSDKGLIYIDLKIPRLRSFTILDGLQGTEYNRGAYMRDSKGYLWFGGLGGINYFHPDSLHIDDENSTCSIQNIEVFGNEKFADNQKLTLKHNQNYFNVNFASNQSIYHNVTYAYKLEGQDPAWNYTNNNNIAIYTGVPPGEYTLKAKVVPTEFYKESAIADIELTILQPWWYTSQMKGIYAVSLAFSVWFGIRQYTRRKLRKQLAEYEKQKAVDDERKRIARDLHDDIGSTLGSISVYSEVAKKRIEKSNNPEEIIQKIGDTSREMIEKMSDLVWSVNPDNDTSAKLITRIKNFAALMLTPANIKQHFTIDNKFEQVNLSATDRRNLFMIIKELIHNCLKYSKAKNFSVDIRKNTFWEIIISDDGMGVDLNNTSAYNGNGMKNIISRAEEIGAEVNFQSAPDRGFQTVLILKGINHQI